MVLDTEMLEIKQYFESLQKQILLSDFWLESCVNWFREQNSSYSQEELRSEVYKQWLFLDFRDIEVPSLPPNIAQWKNNLLHGNFCLQMLYVVDISKPRYWQLQKIRNVNTTTTQEENTDTKRVLKVTLTDGLQEIDAIEYKPVPELNINITPGTKIRIVGPVTVRRGKLMLENKNVKILGGEVEEIAVSNATENILARSLNLPLNAHPNTNCNFPDNCLETNNAVNYSRSAQHSSRTNASSRTELTLEQLTEEEELQIAEQIDYLIENENNASNNYDTKMKSTDVNMFEDFEFMESVIDDIENKLSDDNSTRNQSVHTHATLIPEGASHNADHQNLREPLKITNIESILAVGFGVEMEFKVKAKFKAVTEKLTIHENKWTLKILVADETSELEVKVDNDVISSLIGYSAERAASLKKNSGTYDHECYEILRTIENFKNKLSSLNCVMQIAVKIDGPPILTDIQQ